MRFKEMPTVAQEQICHNKPSTKNKTRKKDIKINLPAKNVMFKGEKRTYKHLDKCVNIADEKISGYINIF